MGDFFEPVPRPSADEGPPEPPPAWQNSPRGELAALVPDRRVIAETPRLAIVLSHIDVYSTGCTFRVRVVAERGRDDEEKDWLRICDLVMDGWRRRRGAGLADELLRFGVEFADGSKATTTRSPWPPDGPSGTDPAGPVLLRHGGGGGGGGWTVASSWSLWLWPLPPAETFDLVIEWPAAGIDLTRASVDGAVIVQAVDEVQPLLDRDR